jgi:glycosyltransferase involved in cell wall biosynthesis
VAARRPFVGTRVDGTPEIIRDGKNGFLVPPGDPAALARALARGLDERPVDPEDERRVLAWDARALIAAQEALYADLVGQRAPHPRSPA